MIPATYPSILDSSNRTKMLVYQVPSITGLTRWVDYIPVKSPTSESDLSLANTFANEGFILTSKVNDITGLVPFKDYVPIYLDSTATKAWSADNDGYIPMAELAGLLLDFTTGSLDARINFSRTTNATVTNSAGLITYAPHNLIVNSENLDNSTWTKINVTISANSVAAPDGTMTADLVSASGPGSHYVSRTTGTTGNTTCFSVYVKANEGRYVQLIAPYNSGTYFNFDSLTGEFGNIGGLVSNTQAQSVGNGWWRVSGVFNNTSLASDIWRVYLAESNTSGFNSSFTVTTPVSVYVWGAQLEIGSTATTYNSTTVKNLLGFSELFDNAAWTKSNSFVQTNQITYSEDFSNAAWTKNNSSISSNVIIAPNGYQTADKLVENTATTTHEMLLASAISAVAGATYTISFYAKAGERTRFRLLDNSNATNTLAFFDLSNGTVISETVAGSSSITPIGNGWYRVAMKTVLSTTASNPQIRLVESGTTVVYTGDGTSGIYIWGAQLVQGSVAGDYRRTDAAALPVYYPNHNGVVCAEKLVENTTNSEHRTFNTIITAPGTYTYSVYLKAAERSFAQIKHLSVSPEPSIIVNLATGNITNPLNVTNYGTVNVGNGYWRVWMTYTTTTTTTSYTQVGLYSNAGSGTYTGDGTSGIYIFGAQLSDSASLDPYVLNAAAAPTAAAYYGARFDYDPVTLAPKGLLIEEQRSNLVTYSNFSGAVAGTPGTSPTTWTFIVSNGITNAITTDAVGGNILSYTASVNRHFISQAVSVSANTTYTASVYINSNTGVLFNNLFSITGLPAAATVTYYANGVLINAATYVPLSGDRLLAIIVISATAGTATVRVGLGVASNDTGTVSFSKPQLEAGAFATSYIPTAASQVTRAADVASIQGSNFYSWYNQNEGTLVGVGSSIPSNSVTTGSIDATLASVNDTSLSNSMAIMRGDSGNALSRFNGIFVTVGQFNIRQSVWSANSLGKISGAYKINDFAMSFNGGNATTDSLGTAPIVSQLNIGGYTSAAGNWDGTIKSISYYPQKLSSDVLKGLTA